MKGGGCMNFIITSSEESAKKLKDAGFQLLKKVGNNWQFINNGNTVVFNELSNTTFTNNISI